jgi:hypothetical protein
MRQGTRLENPTNRTRNFWPGLACCCRVLDSWQRNPEPNTTRCNCSILRQAAAQNRQSHICYSVGYHVVWMDRSPDIGFQIAIPSAKLRLTRHRRFEFCSNSGIIASRRPAFSGTGTPACAPFLTAILLTPPRSTVRTSRPVPACLTLLPAAITLPALARRTQSRAAPARP